jgi:hypothetical protein
VKVKEKEKEKEKERNRELNKSLVKYMSETFAYIISIAYAVGAA